MRLPHPKNEWVGRNDPLYTVILVTQWVYFISDDGRVYGSWYTPSDWGL